MKKTVVLFLFIFLSSLILIAQEKSDSIINSYHLPSSFYQFNMDSNQYQHSLQFHILDPYELQADDTMALIDLRPKGNDPSFKMQFPYKYSIINDTVEDHYYQNHVILLDLTYPCVLNNVLESCKDSISHPKECELFQDIIQLDTRKTQYFNSISKKYKKKGLLGIGPNGF